MTSPATLAPIELDTSRLFFSTTDRKGVIQEVNNVFVEMSRFGRPQLIGAPHNIIRHPDMPGGAFKLMWQTLHAGEPFCAYVVNQAADKAPYTVFATITPLGSGYLSVRSRPCVASLRAAAFSLYEVARPLELEARAQGASAAEAAALGLDTLAELLPSAGVADYEQFVLAALPAEVEARAAMARPLPRVPGDGPLHAMLAAVHDIHDELLTWLGQLGELDQSASELANSANRLTQTMVESKETARAIAAARETDSAPIWLALQVWVAMLPEFDQVLAGLSEQIDKLARSCAKTRFRVALARLHNETTGQFIVELLSAPGNQENRAAIVDLCRALKDGSAQTRDQSISRARLAEEVAESIQGARDLLAVPQSLLGSWQQMVAGREAQPAWDLLPRVAEQVARGEETIQTLASLAAKCEGVAKPLETAFIQSRIDAIEGLVPQVVV